MKTGPLPENEKERLAALHRYNILDTEAEKDFNEIVELASQLCDTPISAISLIDEHRQWFKAKTGLNVEETHRDLAFCAHAIHQPEIMEVSDALKDERFLDNPLVTGDPNIRFYAGMPLITQDGYSLGTLCVIDRQPRKLNEHQLTTLRILAKQVVTLFELRFNISQLKETIQKNKHLANLVEQSKDAIISLDNQRLITSWNQGAVALFGYTTEEVIGFPLMEIVRGKITDEQSIEMIKVITEKSVWRGEMEHLHRNGSPIYALVSLSALTDADDNPIGTVLLARDISERKKIEDELKRSNHFLDAVLEHIPNMVFIKDAKDLHFIRVNKAGARLLGYPQEELVGKSDYDFFPKEQADFFTNMDREVLSGKDIIDIPEEPNTTKGETRLMHTKKISITDNKNAPLYLVGIAEDITERKKLEDQLRLFNSNLQKQVEEKTSEVRDIFDRVSDSFIALDKNWCFTYLNKKAQMMLGQIGRAHV